MRIFVLTTGRAASKTFAYACKHLDGMSAAHESNGGKIASRLAYPDNHVEVDNRLVWFLGGLDKRYKDEETFYVHLTRDADKVVESYLMRWHLTISITRAFYHGILMNPKKPDVATARESGYLFIETVDENVRFFFKNRSNWAHVRVENLEQDFFEFMKKAGLTGDVDKISQVLRHINNENKEKYRKKGRMKKFLSIFSSRKLV